MVLTCTQPALDPPTYLPTAILEMNGMDIPSISTTTINSTASVYIICMRRGFQSDMMVMLGFGYLISFTYKI